MVSTNKILWTACGGGNQPFVLLWWIIVLVVPGSWSAMATEADGNDQLVSSSRQKCYWTVHVVCFPIEYYVTWWMSCYFDLPYDLDWTVQRRHAGSQLLNGFEIIWVKLFKPTISPLLSCVKPVFQSCKYSRNRAECLLFTIRAHADLVNEV